jgi:pSer/pThr/pTyr-binding forkhead associated (FHA) protein
MRLRVVQKDGQPQEYRFHESPIHLGRGENNQVVLAERKVSKRHAVIFSTDDGAWMLEDLDSSNKTFLNDKAIHRARITTGDAIKIGDFSIEIATVDVEPAQKRIQAEDTLQLEATLSTPRNETVVRKPDAGHAPAMRLPAKRLTDFAKATDTISDALDIEELLLALIDTVLKQFSGFHVWCALREQPNGPMTYHAGKRRDGQTIEIDELALADRVNSAVERGQSLVMPRVSAQLEGTARIRSAVIASIVGHTGCYGVIYVDNAMVHEHYSLSDLDYLMFMAIHTSAVLKRLLTD